MATRAYILRKTETGYEGIYNHFDGFPANMLPILENYKTEKEVKTLISQGSVRILADNIYDSVFYHRDCDEELKISTLIEKDIPELYQHVDYIYVFDKTWTVLPNSSKHKKSNFYVIYDPIRGYFSAVDYIVSPVTWSFVNLTNVDEGMIAVFSSKDEAEKMLTKIKSATHYTVEIQQFNQV